MTTGGDVNWPLQGDVSQWINPSWWLGSFGQQLGFINVTQVRSGDPGVEKRIVEEVASYGRQLGWITEALEAVVSCIDEAVLAEKLTHDERDALERLDALVEGVKRVKGTPDARGGAEREALEARVTHLERGLRDIAAQLRGGSEPR